MRTILTLDEDVAAKLKGEARKTGHSLRRVINDLLREALASEETLHRKPFKVQAKPLGLKPGLSWANVGELLKAAEGPLHR